MKSIVFPFFLILCVFSASCTTQLSQLSAPKEVRFVGADSAVSDAWLDTTPRAPQRPHRPSDGLTHWKTGPSIDRIPRYTPTPKPTNKPQRVADTPRRKTDTHYVSSGYTTHYGGSYHGSRRHNRSPNKPFVRTVETVGPPIVPRLDVPTTVRTSPTQSTGRQSTNRYSNRKETHRSGSSQEGRTRANGRNGRGGRSGRGR